MATICDPLVNADVLLDDLGDRWNGAHLRCKFFGPRLELASVNKQPLSKSLRFEVQGQTWTSDVDEPSVTFQEPYRAQQKEKSLSGWADGRSLLMVRRQLRESRTNTTYVRVRGMVGAGTIHRMLHHAHLSSRPPQGNNDPRHLPVRADLEAIFVRLKFANLSLA